MKPPKCSRITQTTYTFGGHLADYLTGVRNIPVQIEQIDKTHFASDNPLRSGRP